MTTEIPPADSMTSDEGWNTVSEESATNVELEVGETFLGIKQDTNREFESNGKTVPVFEFRAYGAQGGEEGVADGELCAFTGSYKLLPVKDIPAGHLVRITRMRDVPMTGGSRQPMKDYRVQSRVLPA